MSQDFTIIHFKYHVLTYWVFISFLFSSLMFVGFTIHFEILSNNAAD